jgi:hypothetical protein
MLLTRPTHANFVRTILFYGHADNPKINIARKLLQPLAFITENIPPSRCKKHSSNM